MKIKKFKQKGGIQEAFMTKDIGIYDVIDCIIKNKAEKLASYFYIKYKNEKDQKEISRIINEIFEKEITDDKLKLIIDGYINCMTKLLKEHLDKKYDLKSKKGRSFSDLGELIYKLNNDDNNINFSNYGNEANILYCIEDPRSFFMKHNCYFNNVLIGYLKKFNSLTDKQKEDDEQKSYNLDNIFTKIGYDIAIYIHVFVANNFNYEEFIKVDENNKGFKQQTRKRIFENFKKHFQTHFEFLFLNKHLLTFNIKKHFEKYKYNEQIKRLKELYDNYDDLEEDEKYEYEQKLYNTYKYSALDFQKCKNIKPYFFTDSVIIRLSNRKIKKLGNVPNQKSSSKASKQQSYSEVSKQQSSLKSFKPQLSLNRIKLSLKASKPELSLDTSKKQLSLNKKKSFSYRYQSTSLKPFEQKLSLHRDKIKSYRFKSSSSKAFEPQLSSEVSVPQSSLKVLSLREKEKKKLLQEKLDLFMKKNVVITNIQTFNYIIDLFWFSRQLDIDPKIKIEEKFMMSLSKYIPKLQLLKQMKPVLDKLFEFNLKFKNESELVSFLLDYYEKNKKLLEKFKEAFKKTDNLKILYNLLEQYKLYYSLTNIFKELLLKLNIQDNIKERIKAEYNKSNEIFRLGILEFQKLKETQLSKFIKIIISIVKKSNILKDKSIVLTLQSKQSSQSKQTLKLETIKKLFKSVKDIYDFDILKFDVSNGILTDILFRINMGNNIQIFLTKEFFKLIIEKLENYDYDDTIDLKELFKEYQKLLKTSQQDSKELVVREKYDTIVKYSNEVDKCLKGKKYSLYSLLFETYKILEMIKIYQQQHLFNLKIRELLIFEDYILKRVYKDFESSKSPEHKILMDKNLKLLADMKSSVKKSMSFNKKKQEAEQFSKEILDDLIELTISDKEEKISEQENTLKQASKGNRTAIETIMGYASYITAGIALGAILLSKKKSG